AARDALGHLAAHRCRPGRGPARQPCALPDPVRSVRCVRRGRLRLRHAAGRAARPRRRPLHPRLGRPPRAPLLVISGGDVPVGGILLTGAGFYALLGFPLDDVWHRLFGQDVTLWGPTHLLMLAGASLTLVGQAILLVEGVRAGGSESYKMRFGAKGEAIGSMIRKSSAAGGLLIA